MSEGSDIDNAVNNQGTANYAGKKAARRSLSAARALARVAHPVRLEPARQDLLREARDRSGAILAGPCGAGLAASWARAGHWHLGKGNPKPRPKVRQTVSIEVAPPPPPPVVPDLPDVPEPAQEPVPEQPPKPPPKPRRKKRPKAPPKPLPPPREVPKAPVPPTPPPKRPPPVLSGCVWIRLSPEAGARLAGQHPGWDNPKTAVDPDLVDPNGVGDPDNPPPRIVRPREFPKSGLNSSGRLSLTLRTPCRIIPRPQSPRDRGGRQSLGDVRCQRQRHQGADHQKIPLRGI